MKINTKAAALGFCYMTLGLTPVYADDTDIFLGRVSAGTVKPNVLFILDNSGSMGDPTSSTDSTSRINTMKESMDDILSSVQGINAGIMQFNDPGGAILYPVSDLDAPLVKDVVINRGISENGDDASQSLASVGVLPGGGDSSVSLTGNELVFGIVPTNITTSTFDLQVNRDDAEEQSNGGMDRGGNTINMRDGQTNGFRFANLTIPQGANIYSAFLELHARRNNSGDVTLNLYAEDTANSGDFTNSSYNISSRTRTSLFTEWQPTSWSQGQNYTSPDISAPIQQVINNPLWSSGNALSIIQTHESNNNNQRRVTSRNDDSNDAAQLTVTYQPAGSPNEHQRIGLRFQNVNVPRGATITNAYIAIVPSQTNAPDVGLPLEIRLEDSANAAPFSSTTGDLTSASTVSTVVSWVADDWVEDQTVQTPDLSSQIQQVTNRSDWCGGNDLAFYIEPSAITNLRRNAHSFDAGSSREPRLVVEYDATTVPATTCGTATIKRQIDGRPHDAEEENTQDDPGNTGNNNVDNNGNYFNIRSSQHNGLHFENLPIAQGATILEARLTFTSRDNHSGNQTITFRSQDSIAAQNFPDQNNSTNISSRPVTGASVDWSSSSSPALTDWSDGVEYTTPDLRSLLQPLVNNASWNPNSNAIAFIITAATGNERTAFTYDSNSAGAAVLEVTVNNNDIVGGSSENTVRTHLKNIVQNMEARTYTPVVDTLYEAARYYRGDEVFWGISRRHSPNPVNNVSYDSETNHRWKRTSVIESRTGAPSILPSGCSPNNLSSDSCNGEYIPGSPRYISPIVESCQQNYIVLLTDGLANQNHSTDLIRNYIGHTGSCVNSDGDEECSEELVNWLANNDMSTASVGNNADGDNYVNTFTIAFALDDEGGKEYLRDIATQGGGRAYEAGSEAELTNAFNQIIGSILDRDATFVVPGTTVSQFNRLSHYEDIYYSVFKPSKNPRWEGNLKKYKISRTNTNYGRIVGQNDQLAVDPAVGFFRDGVSSFWNPDPTGNPDGPDVTKGGALMQLDDNPDNRNVYTYYSGANTTLSANPLDESNTAITKQMLGIPAATDQYRTDLLNWSRGEDVFDSDDDGSTSDTRKQFGDPLHSAPVAITYGGTDTNPDFSIFFATNDGFLHAIDSATGAEHFTFIPELLLPNLRVLYDNSVTDKHPYGIDGNITRWVRDVNQNGIIEPLQGDHVYIYFGLRRGGQNYYALDVTYRNNPRLMWQIEGGTAPFGELGQSWSQPIKARVSVEESGSLVTKDVLIFGGGYDEDQDTALVRTADDEGRGIFMIEAGYPSSGDTPALVWSAGKDINHNLTLNDMDYSIPSLVKVGDTNGDGLVDVMFAGDMGGQIWRIDISNGQPVNNLATGAVIADLAGNSAVDSRRFYADIDASTLVYKGQRFIALAVGSGWRANPLDESIQDRFYMIKQSISKPTTYTRLTENDLYDATANLAGSSDQATAAQAELDLAAASGWFITLSGSGEKVLAPSVTASAQILFSTYQPNVSNDPCNPSPGAGWLYGVNAINATPFIEDDNGDLTRRTDLNSGNIPPSPTIIVLPDGTTRTLVGPEEAGQLIRSNPIHKTYWFDE